MIVPSAAMRLREAEEERAAGARADGIVSAVQYELARQLRSAVATLALMLHVEGQVVLAGKDVRARIRRAGVALALDGLYAGLLAYKWRQNRTQLAGARSHGSAGWQWQTNTDDRVLVNGEILRPPIADSARVDRDVIARWSRLIDTHARRTGVPWAWGVGFIASESWGDPGAISTFPLAGGGVGHARGLMQIIPQNFPQGTTDAEMFDPETNVRRGFDMLAEMRAHGADLPTAASMYNAGPASSTGAIWTAKRDSASHWGLFAEREYIDGVVSRANHAIDVRPPVGASTKFALAAAGAGALGIAGVAYARHRRSRRR